ncbi:MAG: attachment protein [Verrucomicrobia bacterium]|nr:MAG: attachment protein [Verrucomicrobiota bacterium]
MHIHSPHFIVVTDRGALRAGWIQPAPHQQLPATSLKRPASIQRRPSIRWVEDLAFVHPRQHLVEQLSDMAGAYSAAASAGGQPRRLPSSPSETHWKIAADRQAVEDLAHAATAVLFREKPESWSLSAPADIHLALLDALPSVCRQRLEKILPKNLARSTVESIVQHFLSP